MYVHSRFEAFAQIFVRSREAPQLLRAYFLLSRVNERDNYAYLFADTDISLSRPKSAKPCKSISGYIPP